MMPILFLIFIAVAGMTLVLMGARIGDQEAKTKAEICESKGLGHSRDRYTVICYDKSDGRVYVPLKGE